MATAKIGRRGWGDAKKVILGFPARVFNVNFESEEDNHPRRRERGEDGSNATHEINGEKSEGEKEEEKSNAASRKRRDKEKGEEGGEKFLENPTPLGAIACLSLT